MMNAGVISPVSGQWLLPYPQPSRPLFALWACAYMHGGATFLLILLDIIAELRVHERIFTGKTTFLQIFSPKQLLVCAVFEQFLTNILIIRHAPLRGIDLFPLSREQESFKKSVRIRRRGRPWDIFLAGGLRTLLTVFFETPQLNVIFCWLNFSSGCASWIISLVTSL